MLSKLLKSLLILIFIFSLAGFCTWLISQWFMFNKQIPEGVIKVLGWVKEITG
ncbi:hypothetical protein [Anoxybacter fermentans]|uniref:hypothetical protein n=1 Tax=Anoxybacter fermentans TaxID=1323375 RepID=UPI0013E0612D|nr:hypothetical protein [Anoxybacter fermentans]